MKGFTFIDVLITVAVFGFLMAAISGIIVMLYRVHGYSWRQSTAIEEARKGIESMVKEIREAKIGEDGSYIIEKAEDFEFVFFSDIDKDDLTERVRYFIDGADFKKGVIVPEGIPVVYPPSGEKIFVLSRYVRNSPPIFRYFDALNQQLSSPARLNETKLMRVQLVINIDANRPPQDFVLESDVQIRNLKDNL